MKLLQLLLQMSQQTTDAESDICADGAIRSFATHVFLPRITVSPFSASPVLLLPPASLLPFPC